MKRNRSCYSAYEFSSLAYLRTQTSTAGHSQISSSGVADVPLDISLETIVSVLAICIGIVFGADQLQPISWRIWAGQQDKSGEGGPYQGLEDRMGFVDIRVSTNVLGTHDKWLSTLVPTAAICLGRTWLTDHCGHQAKRREFADWVRSQNEPPK